MTQSLAQEWGRDAIRVNAIIAEAKKAGDIDKMAQKWLGRNAGQLPE